MSEYIYTVDSTNYTNDVTFNLKKGDTLKIISYTNTSKKYGYGVYGDDKNYPNYSINEWYRLTGVNIDSYTEVVKKYFFNLTITSEINKDFEILLFQKSALLLLNGGTISVRISADNNVKIKIDNTYIDGTPKIKINGNWTDGSAYVKTDGIWRN